MDKELDGKKEIKAILDKFGVRYEQEKRINFLKGDIRANFFLPAYDLYIEYLEGWDRKDPVEIKK